MKVFIKLLSYIYALFMLYSVLALLLTYAPRIAGITPLNIEVDSIEDKYPAGSLAFVQKTDLENINPGDVIAYVDINGVDIFTYVHSTDLVNRTVVTNNSGNSQIASTTVKEDDVTGKAIFKIPYAGSVFSIMAKRNMNITVLIEIIAAMVIFSFVIGRLKKTAWDNV